MPGQAYELRGPDKIDEANVFGIACGLWALSGLDMTVPEAQPIVRLLEGMGSALRFVLDHSLDHMKALGLTTASFCATVCALVFGKLEDGGGFDFSQTLVNDVVAGSKEVLTGSLAAFWPTVPAYFLRPLVHLCISDGEHTTHQCPLATLLTLPALQRTRHSW